MLLHHGELNKMQWRQKERLPKEKSHNNSIPQVRGVHKIHVTVRPLFFTFYFLEEM